MDDRNTAIRKASASLIEKADDCFKLAQAEQACADRHRDLAARLIQLGNDLAYDAVALSGEIVVTTDLPRR